MSVINTNISALQAQTSLRSTNSNLATSMERLSSGTRINSAKDDAAGLAISTRMTANIRGISAAIRNANDGISLTQTAEGSLSQISDNLQRVRELAVQSANTGNSASDRAAMNNEAKQLIAEIDRVASNTAFNGTKLLDGSFQNQALQVGASNDVNDRISISVGSAKSSALGVGSGSSYAASTAGVAVGATALAAGALNINGYTTGAAIADGVSNTDSNTSGIAVAAAINAISGSTNVTATVGQTNVAGTTVTGFATAIANGAITINGVSLGAIEAAGTEAGRGGQVAAAVNAITSQTGVTATFDTTTGAVALNAADGRNITLASTAISSVTGLASSGTATMAGLASTSTAAVTGLSINGVAVADVADPTVATTGASVAAGATGNAAVLQVSTVTFTDLNAGENVEVGGLTFTATTATTAADVTTAFSKVKTGMSFTEAAAVNTAITTGAFTVGTFTADGNMGAGGVFTAIVGSDTQTNLGVASTATAQPTTVVVAGDTSTSAEQEITVNFGVLTTGQTITVGGLEFTSGSNGTSIAELQAAFNTIDSTTGVDVATAITNAGANVSASIGTFTAGGFTAAGAFDAAGKFTATVASDTQIDLGITATGATAPTTTATLLGTTGDKETVAITFKALAATEAVTVGGLTFTATAATTAADVALAFSTVTDGMTSANATAFSRSSGVSTGAFTGATFAAGSMGTLSGDSSTFTATTASLTPTNLGITSTAANPATVVATTSGEAAVNETSTVTFQALEAGGTVTVGGLTFTAGNSGTSAADLATAFSTVTSNMAFGAAATAAAAVTSGTFTAGSFLSTGAMGAAGVFTATTASDSVIGLTASATENSVVTFSALSAGQAATVNGLTFTATGDMASADVAAAFASLTDGMTAALATSTNTTSAALGTYSGTFAAGFTTGAVNGSTVTASATTSGDVTDIAITSNKFDNLAIAINAKTSETGVTAVNTAGSVALTSTAGIDLVGNTASITGISGTVAASAGAATTTRSLVTLSTTDSAGINISGSTAAALTAAGLTESSATVTVTVGAGVSSIDLTTASGSQAALTTLDSAINTITDSRASMGAYQNRLSASISNLESTSMNLSASRSRILDTDYAKETTSLARSQIISQAATAMLAQANQSGQSVLALLK